MGVFHIFKIVQTIPNRATHHMYGTSQSKYIAIAHMQNISFLCMCSEYLLKMQGKTFRRKLYLPWFLNKRPWSLAIGERVYAIYVIRIWVQIKKMYTSKWIKCLTLTVIFHCHLNRWNKLKIHAIGGPSYLSVGVYTQTIIKEVYTGS